MPTQKGQERGAESPYERLFKDQEKTLARYRQTLAAIAVESSDPLSQRAAEVALSADMPHTHRAKYVGNELVRACDICGGDLFDPRHSPRELAPGEEF